MDGTQGRVLILNKSYEPIGTMGVAQAMCKITRADSSLVIERWSDRTLKSPSGEYPIPSVLRLTYRVDMIGRRGRSQAKRERIYMRDKFRCQYCNRRLGQKHPEMETKSKILTRDWLTLDHIMPQSRGGATRADNLVTACKFCNQRKKDRTPEEARMPLLTPQSLLKVRLDTIVMCNYAETYPEWKPYLFMTTEGDQSYHHNEEIVPAV